jgi:hypothetical protein
LPLCLNPIHERLGIIDVVVRVELGSVDKPEGPRFLRPARAVTARPQTRAWLGQYAAAPINRGAKPLGPGEDQRIVQHAGAVV